jgi:outer membrane lipoprotein SlyB
MRRTIAIAGATAGLVLASVPVLAQAQDGYYDSHHRWHRYHSYHHARAACYEGRRRDATVGTVLGAVGGGLIGNAIGHGRPVGTIVGAGAGALAGHEIAKNNHPC